MRETIDRLLITTYQRVFVREPDGTEQNLLTKGGPFYGLTWDEERLFVGARHWVDGMADCLHILDRDFRPLEVQKLAMNGNQLHQILYHNGLVYVLNTPADQVIAWNPDTARGEVALNLGTGPNDDVYHLNSIWWDGELFWLVGLRGNLWSFDATWNARNHQVYDFYMHNVYREDGILYLGASSLHSLMVERDGEQHFIDLDGLDGTACYVRGLARGKHLYVGAALLREREERADGASRVIMLDDDTIIGSVQLEDTGGMHGIRVLGLDPAHNGIPW